MDQREGMNMQGSVPYYVPQGMNEPMTNFQGSPSSNQMSNAQMHFQSNTLGSLIGSTLPLDTSSNVSPHGGGMGPPSATLQGEPVRRKRGRPRKYGNTGSTSSSLLHSTYSPAPFPKPIQKRRGLPPLSTSGGSLFLGAQSMEAYVMNIAVGDDIKGRILSFLEGRRALVILSCTGSVSSATLRTSGATGTYEGHWDIINFMGHYVTAVEGSRSFSGSLSVTLSNPEGHLIGGVVEGVLIAGSPVQEYLDSRDRQKYSTIWLLMDLPLHVVFTCSLSPTYDELHQVIIGSLTPRNTKPKNKDVERLDSSGDHVGLKVGNTIQ